MFSNVILSIMTFSSFVPVFPTWSQMGLDPETARRFFSSGNARCGHNIPFNNNFYFVMVILLLNKVVRHIFCFL